MGGGRVRKTILFLGLLLLCACSSPHPAPNQYMEGQGRLKVLATTAMIQDVVWRIGRERIDCVALIKGEIDPHSYELVKGDSEKMSHADIIFFNGLGLEHGASLKSRLLHHPTAIALGDYVREKCPDQMIFVGGGIDPHIWLDISLWAEIIDPIVKALSMKDPAHSEEFQSNADILKKEMLVSHQEIKTAFARIPKEQRYLVTSHDAFNYFTKSYLCENIAGCAWQDRCQAPEGLAPEGQLSIHDIQRIIDFIHRKNVQVVFAESNVSRDALKKVVDVCHKKGYKVRLAEKRLFGDSMQQSEEGYLGMIWHNVHVIIDEWALDG